VCLKLSCVKASLIFTKLRHCSISCSFTYMPRIVFRAPFPGVRTILAMIHAAAIAALLGHISPFCFLLLSSFV
jgi:hypothetical protein